MVEQLQPTPNTLTPELARQLNFEHDSSGEWLVNDERTKVGEPSLYEFLPARARVSADGTRYEIGVRKIDLEGLVELARIVRPEATSAGTVINFWQDHPKFSTKVEDGYVFIGTGIEPTTEGFEKQVSSVHFAYDVALESAISGRSYDELKQDEKWYGSLINQIEGPPSGRSGVFKEGRMKWNEFNSDDVEPTITVDTLREYPLGQRRLNAPASIEANGQTVKNNTNSASITLTSGNPQIFEGNKTVFIYIPQSQTQSAQDRDWNTSTMLYLEVPEGEEIKTMEDLKKTKRAFIDLDVRVSSVTISTIKTYTDVKAEVEDDLVKIEALGADYRVEINKPCCPECQRPTWKWPKGQEHIEDFDSKPDTWPENRFLYNYSEGGGEPPSFYPDFEKSQNGGATAHCGDCINVVIDRYKGAHPYASKARAIELMREKLDEAGYSDVNITYGQVWNFNNGEWDMFTSVTYEREGKKIERYTGSPKMSHDGEIKFDMLSHEYVDFRYERNKSV